jgi:hypothetical protein
MTPKEKAKELVGKFMNIDSDSEMFDGFNMPLFYSQRCALIAVNEILSLDIYQSDQWFYQEVKQEIEKL